MTSNLCPATRERWKAAKKAAAAAEESARTRTFRDFVSTELNRPSSIGRVSKILRRMEGAVPESRPGQAISGDCGKLAIEDRAKANAFVRTYAAVSKQVRCPKRDRPVKKELVSLRDNGCTCLDTKEEACAPFSMKEMEAQIRVLKSRKAPGPDQVCTEHLRHLGPTAKAVLLRLINQTWADATIPSAWRRATIIPILKTGKNPQSVTSYRPIALTSHVAKLAERMVGARLSQIAEARNLIPAEQVGFRRGRSVEENLGRLVQTVQDGWNRPRPAGRPTEGKTAEKFALVAYDFSRAYDKIDHRMLQLKLLRLQLPLCMVNWIFQFLRDRRARVEVNGCLSEERPFRAGLPQGSVLAPTLYTLWSADLVSDLRSVPGTSVFMYADDTATLSNSCRMETARERAQIAADTMVRWANRWKMVIAGEKTQALVLSQWPHDAKDFQIKVAGTSVKGSPHLRLLGVTFDRLLHFGEHCKNLRRKVKPRTAQLRKLTGRSWCLQEAQLRTVANGFVRGALEYAAAAWLPAASEAHVELIERELRAAARAVTGCTASTPTAPLMAEAGIPPARVRCPALAARMVGLAASLPGDDPLHAVGEMHVAPRLRTTTGWRDVGHRALAWTGAADVEVEGRPTKTIPPWDHHGEAVTFCLDVGPGGQRAAPAHIRRGAAKATLEHLPPRATWIWSDGSAEGGVSQGGGGATITFPSGETREVRVPAGQLCSSTRAELCALKAALNAIRDADADIADDPIVICTDSQAALRMLESGASSQTTHLGISIWEDLLALSSRGSPIRLQWVPAHCGLRENERADELAKEASGLPQEAAATDVRTLTKAVARCASHRWRQEWPSSFFKDIMRDRMPAPLNNLDRDAAVNVHQLRAGHWGRSEQYLHRIGRRPIPTCQQCNLKACPAARCIVCREGADTPEHVLLRCPCLAGARLRLTGNIHIRPEQLKDGELVAALAAGYLRHKEPLTGLQAGPSRP
ncbi:putative RNA-directed DNA polymerase from transposon BS [Amphibalanus amphitrite]|uniref:Putative RNA-directed DNA polymerase from transposon BS n=1 Tax=Amphibalanus amphitrite TaxID=1232801 RepID=A0A6A4X457_AMPAM|nr:putative RNA-directed DNA polymerase from transposon BS [Amphibalanus amphitrite]